MPLGENISIGNELPIRLNLSKETKGSNSGSKNQHIPFTSRNKVRCRFGPKPIRIRGRTAREATHTQPLPPGNVINTKRLMRKSRNKKLCTFGPKKCTINTTSKDKTATEKGLSPGPPPSGDPHPEPSSPNLGGFLMDRSLPETAHEPCNASSNGELQIFERRDEPSYRLDSRQDVASPPVQFSPSAGASPLFKDAQASFRFRSARSCGELG